MENHSVSILPTDPSKVVALAIARICPQALFCIFQATPDGRKLPFSKAGAGVSQDTPKDQLYTPSEVEAHAALDKDHYWGLYMHEPLYDCFNASLLTVLDVDMKRTNSSTDIRIQKLASWAKENGHMTERSHSKKGRHVIFLAHPSSTVLPKYKLQDHQEIEVFGQSSSPKKSLMLTGDMLSTQDISDQDVDVDELIKHLGLEPEPAQQTLVAPQQRTYTPNHSDDATKVQDALSFISPDIDYMEWIALGQAIHDEFGEAGLSIWHQWSAGGSKYKGDKDIFSHWKSFHTGKGIGLGTLFHTAKQNGWEAPSAKTERRSALEDFSQYIKAKEDSKPEIEYSIANPPQHEQPTGMWEELDLDITKLPPIEYLIDGFIAHGFWVVSGQPGVGKTSVLISLAMHIIGQTLTDSGLSVTNKRKIILVTEDAEQVQRTIFGYYKQFNLDPQSIKDNLIVIRAKRSSLPDLLDLHKNIERHTINEKRPLLILDTANATLDLENENDNSEVGAFINGLKQTIYTMLSTPIFLITHLNKQISRQESDAMARGASAFTGDVTGTAVVFTDEDGTRYMRLIKRRYEPTFDEISFTTDTFTQPVITPDGSIQDNVCRVMTPKVSSQEQRDRLAQQQKSDKQLTKAMDKADEACIFIQDLINNHPEGVIIRRGSHAPKIPPDDMRFCRQVTWDEIGEYVPGSTKGNIKMAIRAEVINRFAPGSENNAWVKLEINHGEF